jgi:hypothetical protein
MKRVNSLKSSLSREGDPFNKTKEKTMKRILIVALIAASTVTYSAPVSLHTGILMGELPSYMVGVGVTPLASDHLGLNVEAYFVDAMNAYDESVRNKSTNLNLDGMIMANLVYNMGWPNINPFFFAGAGVTPTSVYRAGYSQREPVEGSPGETEIVWYPANEASEITGAVQVGTGINVILNPRLSFDLSVRWVEGMRFDFEEATLYTRQVGGTVGFTYEL